MARSIITRPSGDPPQARIPPIGEIRGRIDRWASAKPEGVELVLVDDHVALRDGLQNLLERRGFSTIGVASTVAEATILLQTAQPDVAVIDVQLPDGSGLALTRRLHREKPDLAVMIYTGLEDAGTLAEALESGARGFALKVGGIAKLIGGLRLLARGESYVDPALTALLDAEVDSRRMVLTRREREVYGLLAEGMTGEEVAVRLTISPETIRTHIRNGMEKLHARTRAGAVVEAMRSHEIDF
jgi:DNA-binding NarL/FixJ family response regulator